MDALLSPICSNYKNLFIPELIFDSVVFSAVLFIGLMPFFNQCDCLCDCSHIRDKVIERVFDKFLKTYRGQGEEKVYIVLEYKAPSSYTNLLFLSFILLIVNAVMQFWDDFLLAESFGCTTRGFTCCYEANQIISTPRLDCSNTSHLEQNNITSVICYRFVFKLGTATGSAIAVVATTALILFAITWGFMKLSKGTGATKCRKVLTISAQFIAVSIVLLSTAFLCYNKAVSYPDSWIAIASKISEVYPTGITIAIYIILFPWWRFETEGEYQPINP